MTGITLEQACEHAAWWTRKALVLAAEPGTHPGLKAHLTAASVQHDAAARLTEAMERTAA